MTASHVPVLAGELIELTAPAPGELVVDCTFGAGGHARLLAERIGPAGTLVAMDRDPAAEERFDEFADEAGCDTRFLRMDFVDGLRLLREEELAADIVLFDLGISSMQVDARERGFSYAYDAPLDMRMDPSGGPDARPGATALRRRAARAPDRPGDRTATAARDDRRAGGRHPGRDTGSRPPALRRRPSRQAGLPGDPDRGQPRARRPRRGAARGVGPATRRRPAGRDLLPLPRGSAGQALPRRAGPRLHLPPGLPGLRLRAHPRRRAAQPAYGHAHARGAGREPARALGAAARGSEAGGRPLMA